VSDQVLIVGGKARILKDPDARLDYYWDWTDWFAELVGDSISGATVLPDADGGLVVETVTYDAFIVKAIISGGVAGARAVATCRITTVQGRTEDRSIYMSIRER
jgi:hypothetical protein